MKKILLSSLLLLSIAGAASSEKENNCKKTPPPTEQDKQAAISIPEEEAKEIIESVNYFAQISGLIKRIYVDDPDQKKMLSGAINGMLNALDPHSTYMDEDELKSFKESTTGSVNGIGIQIAPDKGVLKVIAPIEDTPAHKAGLQPGDYITKVDSKIVYGLSLEEAVRLIKNGPAGSTVKLTVVRDGKSFESSIKRTKIAAPSVKYGVLNNVGYVRIALFGEKTGKEFSDAITYFKKQKGLTLHGIVLDLRSNGGGILEEAVKVCNDLLPGGNIVSTRGRRQNETETIRSNPTHLADEYPLVVLVDGGTASAPEIVAGAVQDNKRGIVIGQQTFGKATVQRLIDLKGKGAIKITIARYYTPNGHHIQGEGIKPDILVEPMKLEPLSNKPEYLKERDLKNALVNSVDRKPQNTSEKLISLKGTYGKELEEALGKDYQLTRAVDLINGIYTAKIITTAKQPIQKK